jgi:hypothetical protein
MTEKKYGWKKKIVTKKNSFFLPDPPFETFLTSLGLNVLRQKGCHILVKNWIFDDPYHKQIPVTAILVPVMIKPSGSGRFLRKFGL